MLYITDVIPKQFDPGYLEGDDNSPEGSNNEADNRNSTECTAGDNKSYSDPLSRALPTKQSYQTSVLFHVKQENQSFLHIEYYIGAQRVIPTSAIYNQELLSLLFTVMLTLRHLI